MGLVRWVCGFGPDTPSVTECSQSILEAVMPGLDPGIQVSDGQGQ